MFVQGKKVTIVGMGRTALALARLLLREGARPFVTERDDSPRHGGFRSALEEMGVPYETGGHTDAAFADATLVIPSPGVPPTLPPIEAARRNGAGVIGEMEFAAQYCRARILAVTGTNGKTTTTELLRALIASCGHRVLLAGNNDSPLSEAVMAKEAPEYIVLEVSSYQLETSRSFRPWIASVLNVTPDHLARHGTIENYAATKARIYANQTGGDAAVVNLDDPFVRGMAGATKARVWPFSMRRRVEDGLWLDGETIRYGSEELARLSDTPLRGRHNYENVLCALSMMRAGGFDWGRTLEGLRAFRGVEHRIEYVTTICGVEFYNDSKSTNIDSLRVALESFEKPLVLIAGGRGKGSDYRVLTPLIESHVKAMVTIGEDAPLLEEAFGPVVSVCRAASMPEAIRSAAERAESGDAVLLSPACASFDWYDSFEHRGREFKRQVLEYAQERSAR